METTQQHAQAAEEFRTKRFVEVESALVCYRKAGSGPALVLLHGFPLSGMTWRGLIPALSKHFTCYALNLVGLGDSTSSANADFSSPGQGAVMQQALRALSVVSYALVGNDTGGWVARELAAVEPERVTRLVLTNTEMPGHRPPWIRQYQLLARLPGGIALFRTIIASRRLRRSAMAFGGCFHDPGLIDGEFYDEFVVPLITSPERLALALRFLIYMRFGALDRFRELHGTLSMPVAFIWGADDPTFPEPAAREMATQFPNVAAFISVPRAKLFFYEEQPDLVARLVVEEGTRSRQGVQ